MLKIADERLDIRTQKLMSKSTCIEWNKKRSREWLCSIIEEDGMVDVFRMLYPEAEGRQVFVSILAYVSCVFMERLTLNTVPR